MDATTLLKTIVALIVVVEPLGAAPLFLSLTQHQTPQQRNHTARRAIFAVFLILLISALIGKYLLELFGISLASFKVAGGVLFLFMGLEMINAQPSRSRQTPEEAEEAEHREDIAIVPMALPQLAGPGAIGSVILLAQKGPFFPHILWVTLIITVVCLAAWLCLVLAAPIGKGLGKTGLNILTRIMGLVVVAVAVEFVIGGIKTLWVS
ncbi:MAG: MarC family protein [Armatimonas sp.]